MHICLLPSQGKGGMCCESRSDRIDSSANCWFSSPDILHVLHDDNGGISREQEHYVNKWLGAMSVTLHLMQIMIRVLRRLCKPDWSWSNLGEEWVFLFGGREGVTINLAPYTRSVFARLHQTGLVLDCSWSAHIINISLSRWSRNQALTPYGTRIKSLEIAFLFLVVAKVRRVCSS